MAMSDCYSEDFVKIIFISGLPAETREDSESDFEPSDGGCSGSEDEGDGICNTFLITGPHGVGKTSMVYACAKEMGFKVCIQ